MNLHILSGPKATVFGTWVKPMKTRYLVPWNVSMDQGSLMIFRFATILCYALGPLFKRWAVIHIVYHWWQAQMQVTSGAERLTGHLRRLGMV